jgi:hypothetical protein
MDNRTPACPKCGKAPMKVSERNMDPGSLFTPSDGITERIDLYRCKCGTSFTHAVKADGEQKP